MQRTLLLLLLSSTASSAAADRVDCPIARVVPVASDLEVFDPFFPFSVDGPSVQTLARRVDVYHVVLENGAAGDITALEMSLPGPWYMEINPQVAFRDTPELPMLGPNTLGESFFVTPPGTEAVDAGTIDTFELLASSWTLDGGAPLVEAGGSAVVAVLSVDAGRPLGAVSRFSGRAEIGGEFAHVVFVVPEPNAAVLAVLVSSGFMVRPFRVSLGADSRC